MPAVLAISPNLDMTLPTRHSDEFLLGRENGELFVQEPFSVTVLLTVDDDTFKMLSR
jgi:hypothetical protein